MQRDGDSQPATIPQRCIALFELLPLSPTHHWFIAADWIEEEGSGFDQVAAAAFREGLWVLAPKISNGNGYGNGYGNGNGYGYGNGYGNGNGNGYGYGNGNSYGNGNGNGYGYGNGNSYGDGHGNGYGSGYGYGNGS